MQIRSGADTKDKKAKNFNFSSLSEVHEVAKDVWLRNVGGVPIMVRLGTLLYVRIVKTEDDSLTN